MFSVSFWNFVAPFAEEITKPALKVSIKPIPYLISGISRVLQKLLKYFNFTNFLLLAIIFVFPVIFILNLNDSKNFLLSFGSFQWYFHKLPDVIGMIISMLHQVIH